MDSRSSKSVEGNITLVEKDIFKQLCCEFYFCYIKRKLAPKRSLCTFINSTDYIIIRDFYELTQNSKTDKFH